MNKCLYRNTMDVKWSTFMSNCHIIVLPSYFDKYLTCDTLLIGNHKLFMHGLVSSKKRVILVSADDVLHIVLPMVFPGVYEIAKPPPFSVKKNMSKNACFRCCTSEVTRLLTD